jgi:RNA polymerase sigma-70 factor (ECF subfamily)
MKKRYFIYNMSKTNWNHIDLLAKKTISGDQNSYREFLECIRDYVQIKINRTIPASSRDDVLQEVLLAIHKSLKTLDLSKSCKSWVNAIAHYKVSDFLRTLYKEINFENELGDLISSDIDLTEIKQYITHVTSILNDNERLILFKLKYEGYTVSEVAKEVALSESNIKVISFRAIKKVRKFLVQKEFNE